MRRFAALLVLVFLVLAALPAAAAPPTTAFTYQGKLTDSAGVPLTGSHNLSFKLYDALTAGTQVGSTVTLSGVSVAAGLFTVSLDFGGTSFSTGADRWLETTVGTTTLAPRVKLTPVPSALYAQAVPWTGVSGVPTSFPPSGTAGGDLTGTYPNPTVGTAKIDNTKLASDSASLNKITGGAATASSSKIGIGNTTPGFPLSFANAVGDKIGLFGASGAHYGLGVQNYLLQIHTDSSNADIAFGFGQSSSMTETMRIKGSGNVGIGTSSPSAKLDVNGTAKMTGFQLGTSATAGHVLTANAAGVGTWQAMQTSLPPSGTAGGDLTGTYPNPSVASSAITSDKLARDSASLSKVTGGVAQIDNGGFRIGPAPTFQPGEVSPAFGVYGSNVQVDQIQNEGVDPLTGTAVWQSFTAGMTARMTAIACYVYSSQPWTKTLTIYEGTGTSGTVLTSQAVNGSETTTTGQYQAYVLETGVQLTAGQVYTFSFSGGTQEISLLGKSGDPYAGGSSSVVNCDAFFGNYVDDGEPSPMLVVNGFERLVGIGTSAPEAELDVMGTVKMQGFILPPGASTGYVLTARGDGQGRWEPLPALPSSLPPSGAAGGDLIGTYPNPVIGPNKIDSGKILDGSVASADIADGTVALADMADDSVDSAKLVNGSVATADLMSAEGSLAKVSGGNVISNSGRIGVHAATPMAALHVAGFSGVDQNNPYNYLGGNLYSQPNAWQSFTPAVNGNLVSIAVMVGAASTSALNLSIYQGEGTAGALLTQQSVTIPDTGISLRTFNLATPVHMMAGQKYTFYLGGGPLLNVRISNDDSYAGGTYKSLTVDMTFNTSVASDAFIADGLASVGGLRIGSSATAGRVLTTDALGWGTWQALPSSLPPSGAAGGDLSGTYPNPTIAASAITSAKILDGAVGNADLAGNCVDTSKIVDMSIASVDLAADAASLNKVTAGAASVLSGNIGIGTTTPSAKLDVNGTAKMTSFQLGTTATAGHVLTATSAGVGTWQALPTSLPPSGNASGDLTGTYPSPTIAVGAVTSLRILDGTIALADMATNSVDATKIVDGAVASADLASDAASLAKVSGGAAAVSSGNVGIGTTNPSAKLDVSGTAKMTGFQLGSTATAGQVLTTDATGIGTWQALPSSLPPTGTAGGDLTGTYPNPTIASGVVTSTKILDGTVALADLAASSVDSSKIVDASVALGDLAANSVNSSKIVDGSVVGADIADGSVALADHAANSVDSSKVVDASIASADLASDAASLYKVSGGAVTSTSTGEVGVGIPLPTYTLHVNGTVGITSLPQADKRNVQWDPTTGQLYQAVSSRRYKDNILPLVDDFSKFLQLEPKTYSYKTDPTGHLEIGYIAEDVDALGLKNLVHYDEQGRPDALKYEKMVIYLNEVVKSQQKQIEDQQRQIDELKKLVTEAVKGK